jgi:hypothetical protein
VKIAIGIALAVAGLVILSMWVTSEGVFALLFGWIGFLWRVIPKVQVNRESAAVGAIALVLFSAGVHGMARGAARATCTDGEPRRAWRLRWTAALVTLVIVAFAAGTAMIGVVHQVSWLAKSEQPLLGESIRPPYGTSFYTVKMNASGILYHDSPNGRLPAGTMLNEKGEMTHGWELMTLSSLPAYAPGLDLEKPWNDPVNAKIFKCVLPVFINPDFRTAPLEDNEGYGLNHYAGNSRVLTPGEGIALSEIKDGAASTVLIGEVSDGFSPWGQPGNVRDPARGVGRGVDDFGGPRRRGGTYFGMADGAVRMLSDDVDLEVLRALATPDGAEGEGISQRR